MAEQTFRSPGFFEKEIDLSARVKPPLGIPAGVVGTSDKGPAFVPVIVGSMADFRTRFGNLNSDRFGPYAVEAFLQHRDAVTFMRVLGAGSNDTTAEIETTRDKGTVSKAGFAVTGFAPSKVQEAAGADAFGIHSGSVQFLCAQHFISGAGEMVGFPSFSDNASFAKNMAIGDRVNLLRAVIFFTQDHRGQVLGFSEAWAARNDNAADMNDVADGHGGKFKFVISSSVSTFSSDDNTPGIRVLTASLDPSDDNHYIGRILNTDPRKFQETGHLLYADFAVENEVAPVSLHIDDGFSVALLSGSEAGSKTGDSYRDLFGRYDTRYTTPRTPTIISQPYGSTEYNLFHFETLSDGQWGNDKIKISIANVRASTDPKNKFGTFEVQVRDFGDTDFDKETLESYPECNLDPNSDRYVARAIGDYQTRFDFDADNEDERRLVIKGKYPLKSAHVRIVMNRAVNLGDVPEDVLPFGFQGIPTLKTNDSLTDEPSITALTSSVGQVLGDNFTRLAGSGHGVSGAAFGLTGSIVPPLPYRFKVTRGAMATSAVATAIGSAGSNERVDGRLYWGVKTTMCPQTSSVAPGAGLDDAILNNNVGARPNPLVTAYTKFIGIGKMDALVTGSDAGEFNNNKFTLARVCLSGSTLGDITRTARSEMKDAAYIRDGVPDANTYTIKDSVDSNSPERVTLATLAQSSSIAFNRFTDFNKFTTIFYGGFDGLNILDRDSHLMNDKASSSDTGGKAGSTYAGGLGLKGTDDGTMSGTGKQHNVVFSYRTAIQMMTDAMTVNTNILCVPGMRDAFITDYAADRTKLYSMAIYLMDPINYDEDKNRLFVDDAAKPDVRETSEQFESRAIDNNYSAMYFPDVWIKDNDNNKSVQVPPSIAALGALAFNDHIAYPWFAPAGFNRGGLAHVQNVKVRLSAADRDTLYDARMNPIATFPNAGFVIFGQKTLQQAKSALDRVNVRRMLLEVKRLVVGVANKILFEQNTPQTRARFIGMVQPLLALVQAQAGIEQFQVVMDDTNNSVEDIESNRLNGKIVLVPTRAVEFIAIDFIITNSGVSFE